MFIAVIVLIIIGFVVFILLTDSRLKLIHDKLNDASQNIEKSIKSIDNTKLQIDSIERNVNKFKSYVLRIDSGVQQIDKDRKANNTRFTHQFDSLNSKLRTINSKINVIDINLNEISESYL